MSMQGCCARALMVLAMAAVVAACGDDAEVAETGAANLSSTNHPPVISGSPDTTVMVGEQYYFKPTAYDPDGDTLTYSITGKPAWMVIDEQTGEVTGSPSGKDVGKHKGIRITVSDGEASATLDPVEIDVVATDGTTSNSAPQISGSPGEALVGELFRFVPVATDADGDTLTFTVTNKPRWASFNATNGELRGTPVSSDVGTYSNIMIEVSDGVATDTLGPFAITVNDIALGTATLSWEPPTENTDGSVLENLAGFIIYWGTAAGDYPNSVRLNNPGLTSYVVEGLATGTTYYFSAKAYNAAGVESTFSNEASKFIGTGS